MKRSRHVTGICTLRLHINLDTLAQNLASLTLSDLTTINGQGRGGAGQGRAGQGRAGAGGREQGRAGQGRAGLRGHYALFFKARSVPRQPSRAKQKLHGRGKGNIISSRSAKIRESASAIKLKPSNKLDCKIRCVYAVFRRSRAVPHCRAACSVILEDPQKQCIPVLFGESGSGKTVQALFARLQDATTLAVST